MTDPIRDAVQRSLQQLADDAGVTPSALQSVVIDEAAGAIGLVFENKPATGPFVFYPAEPIKPTAEEREIMISQIVQMKPEFTREQAAHCVDSPMDEEILLSSAYQIAMRPAENGFGLDMLHLSIKRLDRQPIHDWRDLQKIKNAIVGEECEAFEIYPRESRLVDSANQYHLWAFTDPAVQVPCGFSSRIVDDVQVGKSINRKFESPDDKLPSRFEIAASLRALATSMRERLGSGEPSKELAHAESLLAQIFAHVEEAISDNDGKLM